MPAYKSRTSTHGRNMAGARALWRATGMGDGDFGKPIIAIVNSFTQFVPGHVHLKDLGQLVAREVEKAGGIAKEFNTIAVDDGIAMGHDGMLYSLPSREIIADSVEYMVNAHCADAMVCISNCDKITPGMLNAAMRLNIPVVFVSGDAALCEHALAVNPAVHTVAVSEGIGASTISIAPRLACRLIRDGVCAALAGERAPALLSLADSFTLEVEYNTPMKAYAASWYPGCEYLGERTVRLRVAAFLDVMRALKFIL